jgi:Zn-dependent protease
MRNVSLGTIAGLRLSAGPSALVGTLLLWSILAGVGIAALRLPIATAVAAGLAAVALHWASDIAHQLGHAFAARRTGYPPRGIRLWWVLSTILYPRDEPPLPASIHIRRALGGPITSLLVSPVLGAVALALRPLGGIAWWLALFAALDNFLVFALGALLPLGFTDGSTLLRWSARRSPPPK